MGPSPGISRRAVIQLFDSSDLAGTYKDVPCTCTLQFIIRNDRLDMVTSMRSNDAYKGLPHDVFSFTMLQEIAARMLKVELGEYHHFAASLHLYDENAAGARAFIDEKFQGRVGADMPEMPLNDKPWLDIKIFLSAEAAIRAGLPVPEEVGALDPYWRNLVNLPRVFRYAKLGEKDRISAVKDELSNGFYKEYIENKLQAGK